MRYRRISLSALAAVGWWATVFPADLQAVPPGEVRVARLIRRLGDGDYQSRDDAVRELANVGLESRSQLEAATASDDPEVRLRAKALLDRLKVDQLWTASRAQYESDGGPASKALTAVAAQTGNHIFFEGRYGTLIDSPVRLSAQPIPFWEAVDSICVQSGNHARSCYDTQGAGLIVSAGPPGKCPLAYSGPLRAQITSARRTFIDEIDYDDAKAALTNTFQLNLQLTWEDRLRLVGYRGQPEILEAVTDSGVALPLAHSTPGEWNVVSRGARQLTASLALGPPPIAAKSLAVLRLTWGLVAVGDMAMLEISNLTTGQAHHEGDMVVVISSLERQPSGRYELNLLVSRDLSATEPREIASEENDIELFDERGVAFRLQSKASQATAEGQKLQAIFVAESAQSVPQRLNFAYPRIRARKEMEIVFRNVPLPGARLE